MDFTFSKRLRSARAMRGYSMDGLCRALNQRVTKQAISKYESGKMMPDSSVLIARSEALALPVDYFFRSYDIELHEVAFRKKASLRNRTLEGIKAEVLDRVERYMEIENVLNIDYQFKNPLPVKVIKTDADARAMALHLRKAGHLGNDEICNHF